ncbi:hypothetical protein [Pseudomonas viridiflava]|uniref:hypothetical protein n=1 Tax=Pseudomonas viridiflava TaxID=33069 RepID=UPI000F08C609|nr:hypothetical protein [Pseudomonas viridiflava]
MADLVASIKWVTFPLVEVEAREDHNPEQPIGESQFSIGTACAWDADDEDLSINLIFKQEEGKEVDEANLEYTFKIQVYSTISLSEDFHSLDENVARHLLRDMGCTIIGSVREFLSLLTSRSPWGNYTLPLIDFNELSENLYKAAKKSKDSVSD